MRTGNAQIARTTFPILTIGPSLRASTSKLIALLTLIVFGAAAASAAAQSVHFTAAGDYAMTAETDPVLRGVATANGAPV